MAKKSARAHEVMVGGGIEGAEDFDGWVKWTERQREAIEVARGRRHVLYGGAAGGGKSFWLRWVLIRDLIRWHAEYGLRGVRVGLFCRTYKALYDRQIVRMRAEVPGWLGVYNAGAHELRLPEYGEGVICLRNLDDPSKYRSAEFAEIAIDEVTEFEEGHYDELNSRLRWPGLPGHEWRMLTASNPGGIGHAWVMRRWIERRFWRHERAEDYVFIPARAQDNPHLGPEYVESLKGLPEPLREAYLEGRWDVFSGQFFREWDPAVHVVEPFEIPRQWFRACALDYGYSAPAAVGWFAVSPRGECYLYRELYRAGMGPAELAETVRNMTPADEVIAYTVADPSLFKRDEQTGRSNAQVMAAMGLPVIPAHRDRRSGWRMVHEYLRVRDEVQPDGTAKPGARLRFFSTCQEFIRTFPSVVHDAHNREDVDTTCEDHAADCVRYFIMSRPAMELTEEDLMEEARRRREERWARFRQQAPPSRERSAGW